MSDGPTTFPLDESDLPTHWINLAADLPEPPLPPLHPGTLQPAGPDDLSAIFPPGIIAQEVVAASRSSRSPTRCARRTACGVRRRCSARTGWSARSTRRPHIYVKYEGVSPAGSHKPNSAVAQAYENARAGVRTARHRDRRRPVGLGAGVRLQPVRARVRGLHGRVELRPEAVPPLADGDVGRDRAPLARASARTSGRGAGRSTRPARSGSRSPRRSRSPRARRRELRARLGAQPRAACTRR